MASAGTKLSVRHRTVFHYAGPVWNSINTLHLEPRTFQFQKTLGAIIKVIPATRLLRFEDLYKNVAHHFELAGDHTKLEIESSVKVHNLPLNISDQGFTSGMEAFGNPEIRENLWHYIQESRWVSTPPEIWRKALDLTLDKAPVYEKAFALMLWIYSEFFYETGITDTNTHVETAFSMKKGVCQDFTHVMLALCRSIGIAARYASGYIYNGPRDSLIGAQASHAWCEVYLPGAGWIGFDPTNCNLADERYIKIAVGRDYDDVAPIRGSYHGSATCKMEVQVIVERL